MRELPTLYGVPLAPGVVHRNGRLAGPVKDGDELDWVPVIDSPDVPPKHEYEFATQVALEEVGGQPLVEELARLFVYVNEKVVPRFVPFFPPV
jgi:hypothetical protein